MGNDYSVPISIRTIDAIKKENIGYFDLQLPTGELSHSLMGNVCRLGNVRLIRHLMNKYEPSRNKDLWDGVVEELCRNSSLTGIEKTHLLLDFHDYGVFIGFGGVRRCRQEGWVVHGGTAYHESDKHCLSFLPCFRPKPGQPKAPRYHPGL